MRILDIIAGTTGDGPGLRTSIYFAGCTHQCPGCHNPQSWDPAAGREMTLEDVIAIVEANGFDVTLTGGDPLFQAQAIIPLARELRRRGHRLWCYTGYRYETAVTHPHMAQLIGLCDVLVDGPFIQAERDVHLTFRGSANQRLVDVARSTPARVVEWEPEPVVF